MARDPRCARQLHTSLLIRHRHVPSFTRQHSRCSGTAGQVAIAAIVALGASCLAGSPLYLSSVATAAVQSELGHTCLADVGLRIPMGGAQPDTIPILERMAVPLAANTQPSILTRIASSILVDTGVPDVRPFPRWLPMAAASWLPATIMLSRTWPTGFSTSTADVRDVSSTLRSGLSLQLPSTSRQ